MDLKQRESSNRSYVELQVNLSISYFKALGLGKAYTVRPWLSTTDDRFLYHGFQVVIDSAVTDNLRSCTILGTYRMDGDRLLEEIAQTRHSLFVEGHLNENFLYLEKFEKEYEMKLFVEEAVTSYFERSASVLTRLDEELERVPYNFGLLERLLNQIRKYTMSTGANNILIKLNCLRELLHSRHDTQSCKNALREVKLERERFKSHMEIYFWMKSLYPPSETDDDLDEDETSDEDSETDNDLEDKDDDRTK